MKKCIESWKKFSSYIPFSFLVKDSLEKLIPALPDNSKAADIGGGNPLNPKSSSYLLNELLDKSHKNYSLDVYDVNGEQPKNEKIRFILGAVQDTLDLNAGYNFALSVNALQTPSIPNDFLKSIHKSLKKNSYLLLLLPKQEVNGIELFQKIEAIIKQYPSGKIERRYSKENINNYFSKPLWAIESIKEHPFSVPFNKMILDYYFSAPDIRKIAMDYTKNYSAENKKSTNLKSKLLEYFNLGQNPYFEPFKLDSIFLEILAKKI